MTLTSDHKNTFDLVKAQKTKATIYLSRYSQVVKNDHGDVIGNTQTGVDFYVFPVELNPSEKIRRQHGIETPVNVLAHLTVYEIIKKGYTIESFQSEVMTSTIFSQKYKITFCKPFSHNADGFLYLGIAGLSDAK